MSLASDLLKPDEPTPPGWTGRYASARLSTNVLGGATVPVPRMVYQKAEVRQLLSKERDIAYREREAASSCTVTSSSSLTAKRWKTSDWHFHPNSVGGTCFYFFKLASVLLDTLVAALLPLDIPPTVHQ